jgi:hypothetical protein
VIVGSLALAFASAFAGAAIYINVAEHPARMELDDAGALAQWKPSYARAYNMQGGLAVAGGLSGLAAAWFSGDWRWLVGALLMLANWPYTLFGIIPLNTQLKAIKPASAGADVRLMLARWNRLHAVRSGLSLLAVVAYAWATG